MKVKPRLKEELKKYLLQKTKEEQEKVTVVSANKLEEEDWKNLYRVFPELKNKKVSVVVDQNLMAGVVIKHGSRIIDLSLHARLKNLQHLLHETA